MLTLSSVAVCVGLLIIAVIILHNHQVRATSINAERSAPLMTGNQGIDTESLLEQGIFWQRSRSDDIDFEGLEDTALSDNQFELTDFSVNQLTGSVFNQVEPDSEFSKALLENNAIQKQDPQYPLLGSFNQSCIRLRHKLKTANLDSNTVENTLLALYRTAAVAELMHSKQSIGKLPLGKLRMLPDEVVAALDMPYAEIGYKRLKLLCKSDIRRMLSRWGKPNQHQCPRDYHRVRWQQICNRFG